MTPLRLATTYAFFFFISTPCLASQVLKTDAEGKMAAISQRASSPWRLREYACITQKGAEIACGIIVKISPKGAILRFDYRNGALIEAGQQVAAYNVADAPENAPASSKDSRLAMKAKPRSGRDASPEDDWTAGDSKVKSGGRRLSSEDEPDPEADFNRTARPRATAPKEEEAPAEEMARPRRLKKTQGGEVVDLSTIDDAPADRGAKLTKNRGKVSTSPIEEKPAEQPMGPHGAGFAKPHFQIMYDWLLTYQPGNSPPLTFDSYHQLLLLEIYPDPSLYFGFEVSQNPRYFELDYSVTSRITLRFGRIYIPFDDLSPHSFFGGRANVAKLIALNGTAFLPDIWSDLGIGVKIELFNRPYASADLHVYVVNGFGDAGATDPMGASPTYPQFGNIPFTDNNSDKAIGARLHTSLLRNHIGLGASVYREGRYTASSSGPTPTPGGGLLMFGADGQLRYGGTEFRMGYAFMNVGLPNDLGNFLRAGYYGELGQSFGKWTVRVRMGQVQNDNRVVAVTDQTVVGGALLYKPGPVQISFEYNRDLNQVAAKLNYDYAAARVVMAF